MNSKRIFTSQDHILWNQLYSWGKRRHPDKSKQWLKDRYWHRDGKRDWIYGTKNERLISLAYIPIIRYRMVVLKMNPCLDKEYFEHRIFDNKGKEKFPQLTLFHYPIFELPDTERV